MNYKRISLKLSFGFSIIVSYSTCEEVHLSEDVVQWNMKYWRGRLEGYEWCTSSSSNSNHHKNHPLVIDALAAEILIPSLQIFP